MADCMRLSCSSFRCSTNAVSPNSRLIRRINTASDSSACAPGGFSAPLPRSPRRDLDPLKVSGFFVSCPIPRKLHVSSPVIELNSRQFKTPKHGQLRLAVAESDNITTNMETPASANPEKSVPPSDAENNKSLPTSPSPSSSPAKRASLTAREKLRAARVLSRYNETKATASRAGMGSRLLDALKESDKGKKNKGLPEAPTNLLDDSKRGMPKNGLTFSFPGGFDLFVIVFSFVFISTVMFATTYAVWKVGAIHFNDS